VIHKKGDFGRPFSCPQEMPQAFDPPAEQAVQNPDSDLQ